METILRLQAAGAILFLVLGFWLLAVGIRALLNGERGAETAGVLAVAGICLGQVQRFGNAVLRRTAEMDGFDADWLLQADSQTFAAATAVGFGLLAAGLLSQSWRFAGAVAFAAGLLIAYPQPVLEFGRVVYRQVAPPEGLQQRQTEEQERCHDHGRDDPGERAVPLGRHGPSFAGSEHGRIYAGPAGCPL